MRDKWFGVVEEVEWCREHVLCSVSMTNGNFVSIWIAVFLTYHGDFIKLGELAHAYK
jgi:hypothetical protein